jgi:hypothetical protein
MGEKGNTSRSSAKDSSKPSGSAVPFNSISSKSPFPSAAVRQSETNSSRLSQQAQLAASGEMLAAWSELILAASIFALAISLRITSALIPLRWN